MSRKIWKTKSGEKIRIKDMTDVHLRNTILFLKKRAKDMYRSIARSLEPSWYDSSDGNIPSLVSRDEFDPYFLFKNYPNLRKEAKKRKLCVKLKCGCKTHPEAE